jgi:hypothetical protein
MGSYEKISRNKSWSILNWVYKHTRIDKLVCTHTQHGLLKMGVTTRASRKNAPYIYIYIYYPTAGYKITYSVATLSYENCYANLRDYSNSLLCDLL